MINGQALAACLISFAVSTAAGKVLLPVLHRLKFGQQIREEGPKEHQKKAGTPTMGGILFLAGITVAAIRVQETGINLSCSSPASPWPYWSFRSAIRNCCRCFS